LGHQAIKATNALQLALVHSLTLVRYLAISSFLLARAPATNPRRGPLKGQKGWR